ncbi:MAG: tol-pal system-associated acyl-CoA thioesterase [Cellvibrionaceae bacterium]
MGEFFLPVKVYIEDTDAGGIVYHANYLKFMERSRTEYFSQFGFHKPATLDNGLLLVVHSMNIEFLGAARLGDQLQATTEVLKVKRTYVVFEQKVLLEEKVLCRAEVKIACVTKEHLKPSPMPKKMTELLLDRTD